MSYKQNRTQSYSIARIVLNRMIDVLGCINFVEERQRLSNFKQA